MGDMQAHMAARRARRASRESKESKELREARGGTVAFAQTWRNFEFDAPSYDRRTDDTINYQRSRKQKVQILQLLSLLSCALYLFLANGAGIDVTLLAPFKVLPISLMLLMVLVIGDRRSYGNRVGFGLVSCACGDICLELEGVVSMPPGVPSLFIIGLAAGLIGHCAYVSAFMSQARVTLGAAIAPLSCAGVIASFLWPKLPADLVVPVGAYIAVLASMITLALARQPEGFAPLWSWRCGAAGAAFFALSDTLLACDRFLGALPYASALVASSYFLAQFLIAMSARGSQPRPLSKALGSVENFMTGQSFRTDQQDHED